MQYSMIPVVAASHAGQHSVVRRLENDNSVIVPLEQSSLYWYKHKNLDFLVKDKRNIITGGAAYYSCEFLGFINQTSRLVIPIRDPLLIIITAFVRFHSGRNVTDNVYISPHSVSDEEIMTKRQVIEEVSRLNKHRLEDIKEFNAFHPHCYKKIREQMIQLKTIVQELDKLDPLYVPVDLNKEIFYNDTSFCDIGTHASYGGYPLKDAYYNNNLQYIIKCLGVNYDALKERESLFRPLLEKIGYKDLLWWD